MASFTTVMSEYSDSENRRTWAITGHTVQQPMLVIQRRKPASKPEANAESTLSVIYGTADADGNILPSKVGFGANVRYPANGDSADVTAALAVFRDLVASDEFTTLVTSQSYMQSN